MKTKDLLERIDLLIYEKYDTPAEIAANPPKWIKNKKEWKKVVEKGKHSGYGGAVAHYKRHMSKYFGEEIIEPWKKKDE
jgi:hypothetical protein